jgi:hypothetical protein
MVGIEFYDKDNKVLLRQGRVFVAQNHLSTHTITVDPNERIVGVQFGRRNSTFSRVFDL